MADTACGRLRPPQALFLDVFIEDGMDASHEIERTTDTDGTAAGNDNRRRPFLGRSTIPADAVARIFKPSRAVNMSGPEPRDWKLVFDMRGPVFIEPLMGYTGGRDTLKQVELRFPTLASAIRYAERQGIDYVVEGEPGLRHSPARNGAARSFSDETLGRLGLSTLSGSYGRAMDDAANRNDVSGTWPTPMDVVADEAMSLDAKRSVLMNWAWNEYLIDQATNEGMPENGRPSRLHDVEKALLALEQREAAAPAKCHRRAA